MDSTGGTLPPIDLACAPDWQVTLLVPSLDRVRRTVEIESSYTLSRLRVLEQIPGNPVGVAYQLLDDGVVAMMARHLPVPGFNAVTGLRAGHEQHVAPLAEWYRSAGVSAQFELVPGNLSAELGRELSKAGYFHAGFHTSLVGEPAPCPETTDLTIERVTNESQLEDFLDAYIAGWQLPDGDGFKANVRPWLGVEGWQLYLGRIDGRAAAAGILYLRDKVGYCADAATDPGFRGRGLQTALLRRRIGDARAAGVDFVCSGADYLSPSHRSMERVGMRVQFTRATWRSIR